MNHAVLFATVAGLIASIAWGSADFFATKASRQDTAESTGLWVAFLCAVVYSIFFLFDHNPGHWTGIGLAYCIAAGLTLGTGLLFFYKGLEEGPITITSPIGSAYPLVTTLVAVLLLGSHLTGSNYVGILLVLLGIIATSGLFEVKKTDKRLTNGVRFAIAAFIVWGVAFALLGKAVDILGWEKATFIDLWFELVAISIALPILNGKNPLAGRSYKLLKNKFIGITALIQLLGLLAFNIGLTRTTSPAIITTISATYPALTILLALKHFNEKPSNVALAGSAVTIFGIIVLSV